MEMTWLQYGIATFVILLLLRSGQRKRIHVFETMFVIPSGIIGLSRNRDLRRHCPLQGWIDGSTVIERLGGGSRRAGTGGESRRIGLSSGRHVTLRRRWVWG